MKILVKLLLCISMAVIFIIPYVNAGELDAKMEKMARRMVKTINEKYPKLDNATMVVFPFSADEKLTKKKVDFAVTEILTRHFLKNSKLRLVERAQLEKILNEQKLGLSGAIDSETAAKVGQLLGARLSLLGVVSKLGKSYQISVKIADNDTAEILVVDIEEIPSKVFDEEAASYLSLVPETQAIGIYVSFSGASLQTINVSPSTIAGVTLTPLNPSQQTYSIAALGVKYFFYRDIWLADASFTPMSLQYAQNQPAFSEAYSLSGMSIGIGGTTVLNGSAVKGTILYRLKIRDRWNGFFGGGFAVTRFETKKDMDRINIPEEPNPITHNTILTLENVELKESNYQTPIIRAGVEYRPQARFGIGLFGNYYIQKYENAILQHFSEPVVDPATGNNKEYTMEIYKFSTPQIYFEISASLYF